MQSFAAGSRNFPNRSTEKHRRGATNASVFLCKLSVAAHHHHLLLLLLLLLSTPDRTSSQNSPNHPFAVCFASRFPLFFFLSVYLTAPGCVRSKHIVMNAVSGLFNRAGSSSNCRVV